MSGMEQQAQALSAQQREQLKIVDFGFEVQAFLRSNIGKYLVQRAETEVEDAVEALKVVDPEDPKAIRDLQAKIAQAGSFQYWLAEAYQAGENAQRELTSEE